MLLGNSGTGKEPPADRARPRHLRTRLPGSLPHLRSTHQRTRRSRRRPSPLPRRRPLREGQDHLCLNELGYVQVGPRGAELLFQIITEREERASVASPPTCRANGAPCSPTPAWSPPSSTASPSTPPSSKPPPSPTDSAPARTAVARAPRSLPFRARKNAHTKIRHTLPLAPQREHSQVMRRSTVLGITPFLLLAFGCDAPTSAPAPRLSTSSSVERTCATQLAGNEIRGQGPSDIELWGLLFNPYPLPRAAQVKIVWRMTGSGDLTLRASGPQDQHVTPSWGPEAHGSSTWTSRAPSGARALSSRPLAAGRSTPVEAPIRLRPTFKSPIASRRVPQPNGARVGDDDGANELDETHLREEWRQVVDGRRPDDQAGR